MKNRILELDALRGIAALIVVLFHFTMDYPAAAYGFNLGATGVDLFFIISGFVILMTTERCKSWKDFAVSRLSRLFPAYWVAVTFTGTLIGIALLNGYQQKHDISFGLRYLGNLTMVQYYLDIPNIDGPYWTLVIELVFYGLMLVLMLSRSLKHIQVIGAGLLLPVTAYSAAYYFSDATGGLDRIGDALPLIRYFPLFFSGILIYKMKFEQKTTLRFLLLGYCFALQLSLFPHCYDIRGFMSFGGYAGMLTVYYALFVLFLFDRLGFVVNPVTQQLGTLSYSLYLIHQFLSIKILIPNLIKSGVPYWLSCTAALGVCLVLAHLINRYVETPALHYVRKAYKKVKEEKTEAPAVSLG